MIAKIEIIGKGDVLEFSNVWSRALASFRSIRSFKRQSKARGEDGSNNKSGNNICSNNNDGDNDGDNNGNNGENNVGIINSVD